MWGVTCAVAQCGEQEDQQPGPEQRMIYEQKQALIPIGGCLSVIRQSDCCHNRNGFLASLGITSSKRDVKSQWDLIRVGSVARAVIVLLAQLFPHK